VGQRTGADQDGRSLMVAVTGARAMDAVMGEELSRALWEGDLDKLNALAGCGCCCDEHFFEHCAARAWGGCRGQHSLTRADYAAWEAHYRKHHGLSRDQFYGVEER
jgi:hypothetical protein